MRSQPGIRVISPGRLRAPVQREREARAGLRACAGRAGRELDHVRAERAELGRA